MEQIQNTDTLTRLQFGDREYLLVGTAHVSQESVLEVEKHIAELHPSRVCVELDEGRYKSLTQESTWQNVDIFKILKEKRPSSSSATSCSAPASAAWAWIWASNPAPK